MDLLKRLTNKNLKLNKKRTVVTIIGIMLSVALLTAVSSMYASCLEALKGYTKNEKGDFHVKIKNVDEEVIDFIENNRKVDSVSIVKGIGYAYLKESKNDYKPYIYLEGFTSEALNHLSIKQVEGRLPENDNEILITTHLKTNGRVFYKVGDKLTLSVGDRMSDGYKLNQDNSYSLETIETIENTTTKTYEVVGIIERPATNIEPWSAPGYTFITLANEEEIDNGDIYIRFTKSGLKNFEEITASILGVDANKYKKFMNGDYESEAEFNDLIDEVSKSKYEADVNGYLISLERNPLSDNTMKGLGFCVIIVIVIIIVSSVFCIKNSFDISITEKTKQYGMLRSVGATKKQIRKSVFYEAFVLGIIGIPLGLLLGLLASFILCIVCNLLLKDFITYGFEIPFVINNIALLFTIILGIITIYLSALKSSLRASKISPIESIRNSGDIKMKRIKSSKIISKLFGIGGIISYKNVKRNKKKYRTTVISIIVSSITFIVLTYFMMMYYSEVKREFVVSDYNISFTYKTENNSDRKNKLNELLSSNLVDDYSIELSDQLEMTNNVYNKNDNYINDYDNEIMIVSIGDYQFKKYLKENGLNIKVDDGGILYDNFSYQTVNNTREKVITKYYRILNYNDNDIISAKNYLGNNYDLKVSKVSNILPFGYTENDVYNPILFVSDSVFESINNDYDYVNVKVFSNNANKYQDYLEEELKDESDIYNKEENRKMISNFLLLLSIFLYGFIIVISLIGVTNIFNTITTNMELRKREFAMLKSVGMTRKEFSRMIRLESVFMCFKSLVIAIPIAVLLCYLMFMKLSSYDKFIFPYIPVIITVIAVMLLISIIMKFSIGKINKHNIIETIRNENI